MFIKVTEVSVNEEPRYKLTRDEHGNCFYHERGTLNITDYVNSFRNTSALDAVLQRIQYLPIHQMQDSLQMVANGVFADMTAFPKDANEAFLLMQKYKDHLPCISERLKAGESLDSIIKSIFFAQKDFSVAKSDVVENTQKSEVNNNG